NPDHPISLGASNSFMQASILDLYDPDRAQGLRATGQISSWGRFLEALDSALASQNNKRGAGIRFLTGTITSPTTAWQMERILERFPAAKWHQYEPINRDAEFVALNQLFGKSVQPQYDFERAEIIVSLESDFLFFHPASLRYARQFANARRLSGTGR